MRDVKHTHKIGGPVDTHIIPWEKKKYGLSEIGTLMDTICQKIWDANNATQSLKIHLPKK